MLLLSVPPQLDANETTDKGYINQIAVLRNRADLVELVYAEPAPAEVILAVVSTPSTDTKEVSGEPSSPDVAVSASDPKRRKRWPFGRG
jgi:hypothetical protein